jgi:DnaK suppressor protein
MGTKAGLTKKDAKVFHELLLKKKEALMKGIQHIANDALKTSQRDATGDLSAYSLHMADVATDNYDREFSLSLADNEQKLLNRINAAIEKIDAGSYGLCELCEKKIAKARLKAVPYAELCVPCQEKQEKKKR